MLSLNLNQKYVVMMVMRYLLPLLSLTGLYAQKSIEETLKKYNKGTVPYITVSELSGSRNFLLLDTRSKEEFDVSHLKDAIWVGFEEFDPNRIHKTAPDKATPLVVYCSVGVRSEGIGEKLIAMGYSEVKNLYGGIFQWKNDGFPVYDSSGKETQRVHAYDRHWGKLLTDAVKIF
jgi:rhodanese-related sulfurtransferase